MESAQADYNLERKVREKEAQAVKALRQNRDSLQKEVDELRKRVTFQQERMATYEHSSDPTFEELDGGGKRYSDDHPHGGGYEHPRSGERPRSGDHRQEQWSGDRQPVGERYGGGGGGYPQEEQRPYNPPVQPPHEERPYDRARNSPGYYNDPPRPE